MTNDQILRYVKRVASIILKIDNNNNFFFYENEKKKTKTLNCIVHRKCNFINK
jgi:hypothetical protein